MNILTILPLLVLFIPSLRAQSFEVRPTPADRTFLDSLPPPTPSPVIVRFRPIPLAVSASLTGPASEAGTWVVDVCNTSVEGASSPRAFILEHSPFPPIPGDFTAALLTERSKKSRTAVAKDILIYLGTAGSIASALVGNQGGVIAGVSVIQLLAFGPKLASGISSPSYSLPSPIPAVVYLRGKECAEYVVLGGRVRGAKSTPFLPVRD